MINLQKFALVAIVLIAIFIVVGVSSANDSEELTITGAIRSITPEAGGYLIGTNETLMYLYTGIHIFQVAAVDVRIDNKTQVEQLVKRLKKGDAFQWTISKKEAYPFEEEYVFVNLTKVKIIPIAD